MIAAWVQTGKIAASDHVSALLGTGDGRLFGVVAPATGGNFRVTSLDPASGATGATVLVPDVTGSADSPAGFSLYGDTLLMFTNNEVTRYEFATGVLMHPEVITNVDSVIAAASPPCASSTK